jgi:hypothetical protein
LVVNKVEELDCLTVSTGDMKSYINFLRTSLAWSHRLCTGCMASKTHAMFFVID